MEYADGAGSAYQFAAAAAPSTSAASGRKVAASAVLLQVMTIVAEIQYRIARALAGCSLMPMDSYASVSIFQGLKRARGGRPMP